MTIDDVSERFVSLDPDRPADFEEMAEAVFWYQVERNPVYRRFVGEEPVWSGWRSAPALPIEAFKLAPVAAFPHAKAVRVFESSGTSGMSTSRHYVRDLRLYDASLLNHFRTVFGTDRSVIVGHLPGYSDRGVRSSLVYMVQRLMDDMGEEGSRFFLDDVEVLEQAVDRASSENLPLVLFGAAFGLLDLLERSPVMLSPGAIIIETGGMKTHRRSVARTDLHGRLADGFGIPRSSVFSEYGMTELLSQCYTRGGSVFYPPPWMKAVVVDPEDPALEVGNNQSGALRVFDLANVHTVSSILTQDRAIRRGAGFEVIGRLSGAELRGCNFLLEPHD